VGSQQGTWEASKARGHRIWNGETLTVAVTSCISWLARQCIHFWLKCSPTDWLYRSQRKIAFEVAISLTQLPVTLLVQSIDPGWDRSPKVRIAEG
jgi:hypothetical protein